MLAVRQQAAPRAVEGGLLAEAGEGIEEATALGTGEAHVAAGGDGQLRRLGQGDGEAILRLGAPVPVPGDIHPDPPASEDAERPVERVPGERAAPADQGGEPGRVGLDLVPVDPGLALRRIPLGHGEKPREVPVALPGLDQEKQEGARSRRSPSARCAGRSAGRGPARDPRADDGVDARAFAAWWKRGIP